MKKYPKYLSPESLKEPRGSIHKKKSRPVLLNVQKSFDVFKIYQTHIGSLGEEDNNNQSNAC